jgi:antitoxin (DNA-binding transcriptional repressor) of toxin-antitoxin stability system
VIIMDKGKPVLKVIPYTENKQDELKKFRGLLKKYVNPTKPVLDAEWKSYF